MPLQESRVAADDAESPHPIYDPLGVRPFINCCGTRTVHGGSLMPAEVVEAMSRASDRFVNLNELIRAAGRATVAEEIPEAYKDVSAVVQVVHDAGIARKVARLRPLAVVKG